MYDLVVGLGEVGTAVYDLVKAKYDTEGYDRSDDNVLFHTHYRVIHICIPYTPDFIHNVREYIDAYQPQYVFVWSSVPIGTCEAIGENVVHTPVEGKHPKLLQSLRTMVRWVGVNSADVGYFAEEYFQKLGLTVNLVPSSKYTEFLKLQSTSKYGVNIAWAEYAKKVADAIDMPFELVKQFDNDYNQLYKDLGMEQYQRYILDPPDGEIKGHCIRPNAEILSAQYPDELLTRVLMVGEHHAN